MLWLIVVVCCIALGLWQRQNLSTFWREYRSLWCDYEYKDHYIAPLNPSIPKSVAGLDPEAAAIAEIILCHYEDDERLSFLAEHLLKFPQNEFLLCEFVGLISNNRPIDPNLQLRVTERLLSLNSKKPLYYYFLADALLASRNGNDIGPVLDVVERGYQCTDYNLLYDKYKQRVIDLAEKAKLSRMRIRDLDWERLELPTHDLDRALINFANAAFTDGDNLLGTRICDTIYEKQRKQMLAGDRRSIALNNLTWISLPINFGNWFYPESLELQRAPLSKERAKEDRLRLCARLPESIFADDEKPSVRVQTEINNEHKADSAGIAIVLASHFGRMLMAFGLVIFILVLLSFAEGYAKNEKVGIVKTLMFVFACIAFFLVANGIFLPLALGEHCFSSYTEILRPYRFGLDILLNEPILALIFLAVPVTGLLLLQISRKVRWWIRAIFLAAVTTGCIGFMFLADYLDNSQLFLEDLAWPIVIIVFSEIVITIIAQWLSKWRIVWLAATATLFGSLSILSGGYFYLGLLVMLLFIIFSASIIVGPPPKDKSPIASLFTLTDTKPQQMAIRAKCLKLIAPFIVVYWLIFIELMPASAYRIDYEVGRNTPVPVKNNYYFPEPNEATYRRVLARFENKQIMQQEAFKLIGLVMPEDLPGVLEKFRELPTNDFYGTMKFRPYRFGEPNRPDNSKISNDPNRTYDAFLTLAIICSGRDVINILTAAMNEPNNQRALLARAKLGDIAVKRPLEQILARRITEESNGSPFKNENSHWLEKPATLEEIISSLACVSEPNEAAQRYIDYIQRRNMPEILKDFDLIKSINLLPSPQACNVINAYLAKAADWKPPPKSLWADDPDAILRPLRRLLGIYSDREIAEDVFKVMLKNSETKKESEICDLLPYFSIESAELLKKGLVCSDDSLRAWCVWQLRKVGYKFTQEEIDNLMHDKSWMVRTNAVAAEPQKAKNLASRDKNSFVRFVVTLYADSL
jgi:hypothetical protein